MNVEPTFWNFVQMFYGGIAMHEGKWIEPTQHLCQWGLCRGPKVRAFLLLLLIFGLSPKLGRAQPLLVNLHQPPPNELKAADLWVVDLTNPTKSSFTVYLHGTAMEVSNPSNPISVVDASTASFVVTPGFHRVTARDISPIKVNTSDPTYRNIVTTTGEVPTGDYQVCVEVVDRSTGQSLGKDCYDQQVDRTTPPILVMPTDGSTVSSTLSLFTWIAPAPLNGIRANYTIKIVQLLGQQSAYDAMLSNPAFFTASSISNTIFQYPLASRPFEAGRQYAWQITAVTANSLRPISLGSSEVWEFSYDPNGLNGGDIGSGIGGDGNTGSFGNGSSGSGSAIGNLDLGKYSDSTALYNLLRDYFQNNFFIPAGYNNLLPGGGLADGMSLDAFHDPNARNYVSNTPNDSSSGAGCGRPPSLMLTIQNPPFDQNAANWQGAFGVTWNVRHSQPIDHIDLQISLFGHEDAPLAHFIYRTANGSVPTATSFDPRPYILNPDAEGMICIVTAVAVDVLGRSSGPVQKLYANGSFPTLPHIAAANAITDLDIGFHSVDSIVIGTNGVLNSNRVLLHRTENRAETMSSTLVFVNHDGSPHHFRSSYTPPYQETLALGVGGVQALDFGEVMPGASVVLTVPSGVPDCYVWTLYDLEGAGGLDNVLASLNVEMGKR